MKILVTILLSITFVYSIAVAQNRKRKPEPSPTATPSQLPPELQNVKFEEGPHVGVLGTTAEVKLPEGYVFASALDTRRIMEAYHNPITGRELGYVAPLDDSWFAVFEYESVGYVKDDEKNSLDADALLESIKAGTEAGNQQRAKRGWAPMTIIGWETPPRYNESTHNLEWAIRAESEGLPVVNYNTRLLGRGGVMVVTLVTDPVALPETLPKFKTMLSGFDFKEGQKYAEFRAGDKVAQYGLTGLIVGGTTAALVKSGGLKWLWKALIGLGLAVSAFAKKLFRRKSPEASS